MPHTVPPHQPIPSSPSFSDRFVIPLAGLFVIPQRSGGIRFSNRHGNLLLTALLTLLLATGCERGSHPSNIGKPAPPFTIADGTQSIDLATLRGQVVVLNLWASWCAPCVEELPSLLALQRQMPTLKIVAVSMDQDDLVYRRFLAVNNVHLATVRDPEGRINALYGTAQIPETYIIDREGILRRKFVSAQNWTSPEIITYLSKL